METRVLQTKELTTVSLKKIGLYRISNENETYASLRNIDITATEQSFHLAI